MEFYGTLCRRIQVGSLQPHLRGLEDPLSIVRPIDSAVCIGVGIRLVVPVPPPVPTIHQRGLLCVDTVVERHRNCVRLRLLVLPAIWGIHHCELQGGAELSRGKSRLLGRLLTAIELKLVE